MSLSSQPLPPLQANEVLELKSRINKFHSGATLEEFGSSGSDFTASRKVPMETADTDEILLPTVLEDGGAESQEEYFYGFELKLRDRNES